MPHIEQELLTLADQQSSPLVLCKVTVARSLVFCVMSLCVRFCFCHCIVLPSLIYWFWISLWYLQSFPTFMLLLVIHAKQFLNHPPLLMPFSDFALLFGQLGILMFFCICILDLITVCLKHCFKYCWTYGNRTHAGRFENVCLTAWLQ